MTLNLFAWEAVWFINVLCFGYGVYLLRAARRNRRRSQLVLEEFLLMRKKVYEVLGEVERLRNAFLNGQE